MCYNVFFQGGSVYENVEKKWDFGVEEQEWFYGLLL